MNGSALLGKTQYEAALWLGEGERPKGGVIALLVKSSDAGYDPDIALSVSENAGIQFEQTQFVSLDKAGSEAHTQPGPMGRYASRLVLFPFRLNPLVSMGSTL